MKKQLFFIGTLSWLLLLVTAIFVLAAPALINYQGRLSVTATMFFEIYNHETATASANLLWSETQIVAINNGVYNVQLGSITGLATPNRT